MSNLANSGHIKCKFYFPLFYKRVKNIFIPFILLKNWLKNVLLCPFVVTYSELRQFLAFVENVETTLPSYMPWSVDTHFLIRKFLFIDFICLKNNFFYLTLCIKGIPNQLLKSSQKSYFNQNWVQKVCPRPSVLYKSEIFFFINWEIWDFMVCLFTYWSTYVRVHISYNFSW